MLVYIRPLGNSGLAFVMPVEGPVDPGFGRPGGPVDPGYGMPGWLRPGHELPHLPGIPDNSLPTTPPPHVPAGVVLVLVRTAEGLWKWATLAPGSPPPVINVDPPTGPPPVAGQPLPPTAAPKA